MRTAIEKWPRVHEIGDTTRHVYKPRATACTNLLATANSCAKQIGERPSGAPGRCRAEALSVCGPVPGREKLPRRMILRSSGRRLCSGARPPVSAVDHKATQPVERPTLPLRGQGERSVYEIARLQ
jgi:hypothetical protein